MAESLWPAVIGFALGSSNVLLIRVRAVRLTRACSRTDAPGLRFDKARPRPDVESVDGAAPQLPYLIE